MDSYKYYDFEITPHMLHHLKRYIEKHEPVGDFLTAVICNDLKEAVQRADGKNILNLPAFVGYMYNRADSRCWGSKEKMEAWLDYEEGEPWPRKK